MDIVRIFKLCLYKLARFMQILLPKKSMRVAYRNTISSLLVPSKKELDTTFQIMSNAETLDYIIANKCSFSRYGDGEIGYLLSEKFNHFFQPQNKELRERLKYIMLNPTSKCIIGIPPWLNSPQICGTSRDYQIKFFYKLSKIIPPPPYPRPHYASSFVFIPLSFTEGNTDKIKALWKGRDVALVKGKNSAFIFDKRLFEGINLVETIETKAIDAYSDYENIINKIKNSANINDDTLILLAVGLTASVLAYDLSELGYQALDIGHVSNYYLHFLNEMPNIEKLRMSKSYIDGETDINELYTASK